MEIIESETVEGVITPVSELPKDAKLIVFNGTEYVIYEDGDELPSFE